jgi:hypothetical protein
MKKNLDTQEIHIKPQFIFDNVGNKKAVILDILTFESLLEALEDTALGKLTKEVLEDENEFVDLDELKDELNFKD